MTNAIAPASRLLNGKTAIITGGASGIGLAIARAFAAHGARVFILDRNDDGAAAAAKEINAEGGKAEARGCDVSEAKSVRKAFESIFKLGPVQLLVNCAGVAHVGTVSSTDEDDFDRVMRINVRGMYLSIRATIEHMKQQGGGVILNMASIAASAGLPDRFAYSTSKGAVLAMTYSVARDYLDDKIRCNAISPARVHTPFVDGFVAKNYPGREAEMMEKLGKAQPIGRMAEPEEVASLAVWLCSDEATFVTGANYPLDGGFVNLR
ncbi:MAG TPA: SDR family oxidoreductase [Acidobacteriaceae bacterium]|jgi:NAD(P)-dependent dehydrogenase (short-subunit alcohol dehydrogenase family)|nr:SDR family oxidoreductase [Acidobacteriaceae bacterium]